MIQRNPTYTPDVAETLDYKPLSLLAVAGLALAAGYTTLLLIGATAAQIKGEPFFEPFLVGAWAIVLPIGGAVLSGLALWEIHSSEGTRAGTVLAKWGLGLSLVTGLGYFTYQTFTELAILQQANRFLLEKDEASGFFPRLQGTDGDVRTAFGFTRGDFTDRSARPESAEETKQLDLPTSNNPKGLLTQFLEQSLVRAIHISAPGTVKIEPSAVLNWAFDNRAYQITRIYRIATDEALYEVPITVWSIEPLGEGEKRRWKVDWQPHYGAPLQPLSRTDLGKKRQVLRQRALEFLSFSQTGWFSILKRRETLEAYLGTRPVADRKELRARAAAIHERTPLVALVGAGLPPLRAQAEEQLKTLFLPHYWPLNKTADYFKVDSMRAYDPVLLARAKDAARQALTSERLPLLPLRVLQDEQAACELKNGEMLVSYQVEMVPNLFTATKAGPDMLLLLKAVVAAPEHLDPATSEASQPWRVKSVEFVRALTIPRQQN
jgi:hypothetical protein